MSKQIDIKHFDETQLRSFYNILRYYEQTSASGDGFNHEDKSYSVPTLEGVDNPSCLDEYRDKSLQSLSHQTLLQLVEEKLVRLNLTSQEDIAALILL